MTVVQLSDARARRRVSRLLPRILSQREKIIEDVCRSTAEYPPEWLQLQLEKNFEHIVHLILSGDTETPFLGRSEIKDELDILGLLS